MMGRRGNVLAAQAFLRRAAAHRRRRSRAGRRAVPHDGRQHQSATAPGTSCRAASRVKGSLRTFNATLREQALGRLHDLLHETDSEFEVKSNARARAWDGAADERAERDTHGARRRRGSLIGDKASILGRPLTVSDDFAEFLTRIPGCYFMLGAMPEGDRRRRRTTRRDSRSTKRRCEIGVKVLAGAAVSTRRRLAAPPMLLLVAARARARRGRGDWRTAREPGRTSPSLAVARGRRAGGARGGRCSRR